MACTEGQLAADVSGFGLVNRFALYVSEVGETGVAGLCDRAVAGRGCIYWERNYGQSRLHVWVGRTGLRSESVTSMAPAESQEEFFNRQLDRRGWGPEERVRLEV